MEAPCVRPDTNSPDVNSAFGIALGDIYANIQPFKDDLFRKEEQVLLAGLGYDTPCVVMVELVRQA